jgi:hypothetical protein
MEQFKVGDFDLVLLGSSIPAEPKERLTGLVRTSGSRTPVVCIPNPSGDRNSLADGTRQDDASALRKDMEDILAKAARARAVPAVLGREAAAGAAYR